MVIVLSLNESLSAALSSFAPHAFIVLLSISMALGPNTGSTITFTGRDVLPRVSTNQICPGLLRGDPIALRNYTTPGGIFNTRAYCKVAWFWMKFSSILGTDVAESIMSRFLFQSSGYTSSPD